MTSRKKHWTIRELKRSRGWMLSLFFAVCSMAVLSSLWFLINSFIEYGLRIKINNEYTAALSMERLYEGGMKSLSSEEVYRLLDAQGSSYLIKDGSGKILHEHGIEQFKGKENFLKEYKDIEGTGIWFDPKEGFLYYGEDGEPKIDILEFAKTFSGYLDMAAKLDPSVQYDERGDIEQDKDDISKDIRSLKKELKKKYDKNIGSPLWISIDVKSRDETFFCHRVVEASLWDIIFFSAIMALIMNLIFGVFLIVVAFTLRQFFNHKRTLRLFFTDNITLGNNFMWFIYEGERFLKRRDSAKKVFAVVDMVFVKYSNYCVCHSREEGEKALKKVYETMRSNLLKGEMCARCADANFAMLLEAGDKNTLESRLKLLIRELEKIDKDHVFCFHAGVYIIEPQRDVNGKTVRRKNVDIESDYNNAAAAVSTLEGNDRSDILFFDNNLYEKHKWESIVTEQEKKALDNKEFLVYYQPKYDPKTDKLKGAEALIRWNSPEYGLVSPGRFIPIFENNGFIKEIDHYMLKSVAADQKRWFDEGKKCVPISVNVSRAHFIESDLAEQIRDIVDREGTARSLIEIELTESAFFDDKEALVSIIEKLKEYGFSVSMDDFGSGYSSLNSLKDLPLDVLKLDAEFFRGGDKDRGEKVVSETIKLAKSLKMRTVAEGVEIKDQVEFLAEQGCDMIQGYYYAKPMPKNEFEERMEIVE